MEQRPNIFRCKVRWGCFWQDRPEDSVAMYRELLASPVFTYIQGDLLRRELHNPRLCAWNELDRQRLPRLWNNFVDELNSSSNWLFQIEGGLIELADAKDDPGLETAFDSVFARIFSHRDEIVTNNVELTFWHFETMHLITSPATQFVSPSIDRTHNQFISEFVPRLNAMNRDFLVFSARQRHASVQSPLMAGTNRGPRVVPGQSTAPVQSAEVAAGFVGEPLLVSRYLTIPQSR